MVLRRRIRAGRGSWVWAGLFEVACATIAAPSIGVLDDFVFLHWIVVGVLNRIEGAVDQAIVLGRGIRDLQRKHAVFSVSYHTETAKY